jgi:hypothetical protein
LLKQNRLDESEDLLNQILEQASDPQAVDLLSAVQQARITGVTANIDILISTALSDFFTEISAFTRFFLERADFKGLPPDRIQAARFNQADVELLDKRATQIRTNAPRERSSTYLSAAKIQSMLDDYDPNRFYRYLGRSFASLGDAIVIENGLMDSACDVYSEALSVYDNDHTRRSQDEQDAQNALVRFLFATLGVDRVPMASHTHLSIDEALESVIGQHPSKERVFHYIAYLIYRSRYAAARILKRLYDSNWRSLALAYLAVVGVGANSEIKSPEEFAYHWDELRRKHFDDHRIIANEFRILLRIELTTSTLEDCINRLRTINDRLFFDLDRQRLHEFQRILEISVDLDRQSAFEDRERLCLQAKNRCQELMREVEVSPTKFSIEQMFPVLTALYSKLDTWLDELYQRSTPALRLRLVTEQCFPDSNNIIEVQIAIENQAGRSPADNVELFVDQEDGKSFKVLEPAMQISGSLRGGDKELIPIVLEISPETLTAEAFSLAVFVQYRMRSKVETEMIAENFSIQLYPEEEFEALTNPYRAYEKGTVVVDKDMFYGRDELINGVVKTLETTLTSKSIVLYGQRRSGKSSILYHIKEALSKNPDILTLYTENIGIVLDSKSSTPLLYQILWSILRQLQRSIHERERKGYSQLELLSLTALEFYSHPAPLSYFNDLFEEFKDRAYNCPRKLDHVLK